MVESVHAGLGAQADAPGSQLIPRVCHVAEHPGLELSAIINKNSSHWKQLNKFPDKKYFDT
jgi:hypothetical protein